MINIIRAVWAALISIYGYFFIKDYKEASKAGKLENVSVGKAGFIGLLTNFFDTLGIGSFATTMALNKIMKLGVKDKELPGLLNVSYALPIVCQAVIFTTTIKVEPITLMSMLVAAALGSYLGAGIIGKMDEIKIQKLMGVALLATAVLMIFKQLGLIQGGGDAIGLSGIKLGIGIVGNFILGALMSAGIGLYSPCMALVYFLGLSPQVAFPIMMGSCATLMPVGSIKFIEEGNYPRKTSLILSLSAMVGVFIAAYLVKSLPIDILTWLVIGVMFYTSTSMLIESSRATKEVLIVN